ncbi:low affinity iron permease family protein [Rhizobium leguminosarum]|jgi:low affinity Fe/Cu permease|uniref:Low affinity iron permease family protein n=1 Tax=Rhizobium leguminosarum TaxID=384 RepID=A0AAJ1AAH3_RHILE|nr:MULTISPECIES: low affinity iron permease family protein [Rhizobium]MBY3054074.1 low affinity iron permease family protein [Rhizobium laguerreae]MBY3173687.1 low affinity iron permease family protein [Rhizobium leguminosarum]MBY5531729.1 low affinity iron permease family protein [Rhizobium leguminosarum]MBY5593031.1 low affinity iron permease family protein [Rhizobium leguminosarum]MBY5613826.1 low affinity iron permease family protein [Rhizobium leguminosarum]
MKHLFARFATKTSEWAGKPVAFILALTVVVIWASLGPFFDYSETWQLIINTGTTIITFLMVFVLQNAQTRDTRAIQAKLNEIILTSHAENRFIGIENLDEEELKHLNQLVAKAAKGRGETEACRTDEAANAVPSKKAEARKRSVAAKAPKQNNGRLRKAKL